MSARTRPRIGITAWHRVLETGIGPTPLYTVNRGYVEAIEAVGGIPVLLPGVDREAVADVIDVIDGLLVTGGADVDSSHYGQPPHPAAQVSDPQRDSFEIAAVLEADQRAMPAFCICRGVQVLNVARGGSLIQDIPDLVEGHPNHYRADIFDSHAHEVKIEPGARLAALAGTDRLSVNSLHHQAVEVLGQGLHAVAWAPEGFIEAVEDVDPDRFLIGVQWHPELLFGRQPEHLAPFRALVEAAAVRIGAGGPSGGRQ